MLKPLTMDGLAAELKSIHERIDHQYASLRRSGIVQEDRASFLIPLVLEHCDNTSDAVEAALRTSATACGLLRGTDDRSQLVVLTAQPDDNSENAAGFVRMVDQLANKYLRHYAFFCNDHVVAVLFGNPSDFDEYLHILADEICQLTERALGQHCVVGVSRAAARFCELNAGYRQSMEALAAAKETEGGVSFTPDVRKGGSLCERALEIIEQHYSDEDLSLASLSAMLDVSPNHLSACIKKTAGTQLTMRTFHTGGVAGTDITQGLPRVEEIFEARKPKGLAIITEFGGVANIKDTKKKREIIVTNNETGESKAYLIPYGSRIKVMDGAVLEAGDELTEGSVNPHDILKIKGVRAVQDYMLREVQRVYRLQGVEINDKHIELIVRQMLQKVRVETNGDSDMLPGTLVDTLDFEDTNELLESEGKEMAEGKQVLLGITKASLATNSFLSAASFQETTKVLTEAAIKGKVDPLIGMKENVIIGKLIPAGTGMKRYRNIKLDSDVNENDEIDFDDDSFADEEFAPVEE